MENPADKKPDAPDENTGVKNPAVTEIKEETNDVNQDKGNKSEESATPAVNNAPSISRPVRQSVQNNANNTSNEAAEPMDTTDSNAEKGIKNFNDGAFILEVQKRPMIYDTNHKHYKHNNARAKAWGEIVAVLRDEHNIKTTEVNLQKRWKAIRGRYRKAVVRGIPNGGTKCIWVHQHLLGFLDPFFAENDGKPSQSTTADVAEESNSSVDEGSHSSLVNGEPVTEPNTNTPGTTAETQNETSKADPAPKDEKMDVDNVTIKTEVNGENKIKEEIDKKPDVDLLNDIKTEADITDLSDKNATANDQGDNDEKASGDASLNNESGNASKVTDHAMWPQEETYKLINAFKEFEDQIFITGVNNVNIRPAIKYLLETKTLDDKTEEQIKSKWRTLFRTYKLIRDKRIVANDTRDPAESNSPRYPYYSAMVDLLSKHDKLLNGKVSEKIKVTRNTTKESQPPPPPPPPKPVVETKESSEDEQDDYESDENHIKAEENRWRNEYIRIKIEYLKMKKKHDTHKMNALKKLLKIEEKKIELLTQIFDPNAG